jgi:hypothetical protein
MIFQAVSLINIEGQHNAKKNHTGGGLQRIFKTKVE